MIYKPQFAKLDASQISIPYYQNWLGPWAMHERSFKALEHAFQALDLNTHLTEVSPKIREQIEESRYYNATIIDGIIIVNISGPIMKQAPSFGEGCSSVLARRILMNAVHDTKIFGAILLINSPGGTVSGTRELANTVKNFSKFKPIWAFCEDLTASAAYWIASQAERIIANPTALVGSIGTYCVVVDSSGAAEKAGVKVNIVRAGEYKGMGTPGTEVTEEHLDEMQTQVSGLNQFFVKAVSEGRNLEGEALKRIADGRCHLAADAMQLGLIDDIADFEDFFESFYNNATNHSYYQTSPNRYVTQADLENFRLPDAKKKELVDFRTEYCKAIEYAKENQTAGYAEILELVGQDNSELLSYCHSNRFTVSQVKQALDEQREEKRRQERERESQAAYHESKSRSSYRY